MKKGTKVSWANNEGTHATRVYGTLLADGDPAIVAPHSLSKVSPAYAVAASRIVEVADGEDEQAHEKRIRDEAAGREIAAAKAARVNAEKPTAAPSDK